MKNTVLFLLSFFFLPGCNDDEQTDKQDNESPKVIDTTAPTAPVIDLDDASDTGVADDDNITSDRTPTFTITNYKAVSDADNVSVKWFIDDVEQAGETGATFTTSELLDGTYTVHAQYTDATDNFTNSEELAVTIDATTPTAPMIDLDDASDTGVADDDNITSDKTPTFTITNYKAVTDVDNVSVKWFIDDVEQAGKTGATFTTSELLDGTYIVTAQFMDVSGNMTGSNAITTVIKDDDNPSDCGCESEIQRTISESEELVGKLSYKTQADPMDDFYNNHFWIIYPAWATIGDITSYMIVCNESFLSDDLSDLKNLAPEESIEVKFSGNRKSTCKPWFAPALYSYNRITLTSIQQQ